MFLLKFVTDYCMIDALNFKGTIFLFIEMFLLLFIVKFLYIFYRQIFVYLNLILLKVRK